MNKYYKFARTSAIIGVLGALASTSSAQSGNLYLTAPYTSTWDWSSNFFSGEGGPFVGTFTPTDPNNPSVGPIITYCTSVNDDFSSGQTFPVTLTTAPPTEAGWLVDNIQPDVTDGAATTGLQLAIWAVTPTSGYDTNQIDADLASQGGSSSPYLQTYQDFVNDLIALNGQTADAYNFNYTGSGQPQIAPTPNFPPPGGPNIQFGAPGPAAAIPFGIGLIGKLRRRNKARKA